MDRDSIQIHHRDDWQGTPKYPWHLLLECGWFFWPCVPSRRMSHTIRVCATAKGHRVSIRQAKADDVEGYLVECRGSI